jgi:hypothetical protein
MMTLLYLLSDLRFSGLVIDWEHVIFRLTAKICHNVIRNRKPERNTAGILSGLKYALQEKRKLTAKG